MGSARGAVNLAARLAGAVGGWALVPDYRLSPEHAFPAALDDVATVHSWLMRRYDPARVVISGECAGGGSPSASRSVCATRVTPFRTWCTSCHRSPISPRRAPTHDRTRHRIPGSPPTGCGFWPRPTSTGRTPRTRRSPPPRPIHGLPPLLIQAAAGETLAGDARRLAERARAAGVDVTLELVQDTVHSFVLFEFLPESGAALNQLAALLHNAAARSASTAGGRKNARSAGRAPRPRCGPPSRRSWPSCWPCSCTQCRRRGSQRAGRRRAVPGPR